MKMGQKIRNAREDRDLSQATMATMIPMNQSNYSKIERNIQEPSIYQLQRICEILSLDPRDLLELNTSDSWTQNDTLLLKDIKALIAKHSSMK